MLRRFIAKQFFDLKKLAIEVLFPEFCVVCGREGKLLCSQCFDRIEKTKFQTCPHCPRLTIRGETCSWHRKFKIGAGKSKANKKDFRENCLALWSFWLGSLTDKFLFPPRREKKDERFFLTGLIVAAKYEEPLPTIIHEMKYNSLKGLLEPLGKILIDTLNKVKLRGSFLVVPVPLHFLRKRFRGFNQAEELGKIVAEKFDWEIINAIKKKWTFRRQVQLSGAKRRQKIKGKFNLDPLFGAEIKGRRILLVDDVATTGTTLNECAKVLKKAGAREIWGLVLARG